MRLPYRRFIVPLMIPMLLALAGCSTQAAPQDQFLANIHYTTAGHIIKDVRDYKVGIRYREITYGDATAYKTVLQRLHEQGDTCVEHEDNAGDADATCVDRGATHLGTIWMTVDYGTKQTFLQVGNP